MALNIHQALRIVFENPANQYGFMKMKNHNPYFSGRSPLEVIGGNVTESNLWQRTTNKIARAR